MRFISLFSVLAVSCTSLLGCSGQGDDLDLGEDGLGYPPGTVAVDAYGNPVNEYGQLLDASGSPILDATGQPVSTTDGGNSDLTAADTTSGDQTVSEPETMLVCTPVCSDEPPPDQAPTCEEWASWGMCDPNNTWFSDYCNATCDRCEGAEEICETVIVEAPETDPIEVPPLPAGSAQGWGSRYWDCCKQHCAWDGKGATTAKSCDFNDNLVSDANMASSCDGGGAYTCWSMAPWAVSDTLAYGYAATPSGGNDCGKCYQLDFLGTGEHNAGDPGSRTLAGKSMIVQSSNVGGDVGTGQFDLLIPGGGVGLFDGCSTQWGTSDLGARYGGFLTACSNDVGCLKDKCESVFSGKPELLDGCLFHAEWMSGANNPQFHYKEVDCPAALEQRSGMVR